MTSALVCYSYYKKYYSYSCDPHIVRSQSKSRFPQKPPNCDDFYRDRWQRSILSYFFHKLKWSYLILTLLVLVGHFQCKFIITKHQIWPTFRRFRNLPLGASPLHGNTSQSSSSHSVSLPTAFYKLFLHRICVEFHALVSTPILTSFLSGYLCFIINSIK